jgi:hypothetical protein
MFFLFFFFFLLSSEHGIIDDGRGLTRRIDLGPSFYLCSTNYHFFSQHSSSAAAALSLEWNDLT